MGLESTLPMKSRKIRHDPFLELSATDDNRLDTHNISKPIPSVKGRRKSHHLGGGNPLRSTHSTQLNSPLHINLQIRPDAQNGRRDLQGRGVVQAFEVGREEQGRRVDEGKRAGGVEDGVAECLQDGAVEGGEDGILEDYARGDGVGFACFG